MDHLLEVLMVQKLDNKLVGWKWRYHINEYYPICLKLG